MKVTLKPDKDLTEQKIKIGKVPALIVRPTNPDKQNNVGLLWIHGGGYILGMKEMVYMGRAADLAKKFGVTVVSPGYCLAWQKPYPAAVNDCFEVLAYMEREMGFDAIMVGGESAGGGLCASVCMMARDRGVKVAYQFPLYPMISNLDTESSRDNHGKVWNTRRNHLGWRLYLRGEAKGIVSPYAAPAHQTDYSNLPPCYTFVGDGEPFYAETLAYVENLRKAGVKAEVDVYPTNVHAFDMMRPEEEISKQAIQTFEEHFAEAMETTQVEKAESSSCKHNG